MQIGEMVMDVKENEVLFWVQNKKSLLWCFFCAHFMKKINISHTCDIIDFVTQSLKRKRDT